MEKKPNHNSKVANVDDIPDRLHEILNEIRLGREIVLTEHNKIVAKIVPVSNEDEPEKWPDFYGRAIGIFGESPKSSACDSLTETREERF